MDIVYGINVKNKYELFYNEDVDPLEILAQHELAKKTDSDKKKKDDKAKKNNKSKKTVQNIENKNKPVEEIKPEEEEKVSRVPPKQNDKPRSSHQNRDNHDSREDNRPPRQRDDIGTLDNRDVKNERANRPIHRPERSEGGFRMDRNDDFKTAYRSEGFKTERSEGSRFVQHDGGGFGPHDDGGFRQREGSGFGQREGSGFGQREGGGFRQHEGGGFGQREGGPSMARGDSRNESGFGRARGRGRGRGRGAGRGTGGFGGKREFERHSGSDRTSNNVKPLEKKEGSRAHNWGTMKDDLVQPPMVDYWRDPKEQVKGTLEEPQEWNAPTENVENKEPNESRESVPAEIKEEGPIQLTLEEWKKMEEAKRVKYEFKLRKANEGVDTSQWKGAKEYRKSEGDESGEEEDTDDDEEDEDDKDESKHKRLVNEIKIMFNDSSRRGRGGRRPRGNRGSRSFGRGGDRRLDRGSAPKFDDENDFPSLIKSAT